MTDESKVALQVLYRLKRRLGKERARFLRFYTAEAAKGHEHNPHRDRCWYEMNICDLAMGFVDREIHRLKGDTK